jgi:hypothetical protein
MQQATHMDKRPSGFAGTRFLGAGDGWNRRLQFRYRKSHAGFLCLRKTPIPIYPK